MRDEAVRDCLNAQEFYDYEVIYGDLYDRTLLPARSFDFALAHLFVDALEIPKLLVVLENLFKAMRNRGELVIIDREAYFPCQPKYEQISMGQIKGKPALRKRTDRDLVHIVKTPWQPARNATHSVAGGATGHLCGTPPKP